GVTKEQALRLAGAVEHASEHPIGRAIATAAQQGGSLPTPADFVNVEGRGVRGTVEDTLVLVGRESYLTEQGIEADDRLAEAKSAAEADGKTAVLAAWNGRVRAVLVIADAIKPTSAEAIARFTELGLTPVLLTGDNRAVAERVATEINSQIGSGRPGIQRVVAEVLPQDKVDVITELQDEGRVVAMVGDGVNDAAALAAADLGLAMGTGTDAAIEAADLTLVRGDLRVAADAIRLSRRTLRTIRINLFWAFAYNVAAIPLAASGLLNPMLAGAAMAVSSLFVVGNSLRLRAFR